MSLAIPEAPRGAPDRPRRRRLATAADVPDIHVNDDYMRTYRPLNEPYYYNSKKYDSYLEQLGIDYPNPPTKGIRRPAGAAGAG